MAVAISDILENEGVVTHFQPIMAVKSRALFGVEALSRGVEAGTGRIIPPYQLFMAATAEDRIFELEGLCRKKALETFRQHHLKAGDSLLFLNFEVSVLDQGLEGAGQLLHLAEQLGIPAERVVIEITESKVENTSALGSFIHRHRAAGFRIALDDIGAGHSNLDRIALFRPDILKVDASLIRGLEKDPTKQEIFRSVANLALKTGALVLAEGVETASEALASLELGAELVQGYYLGRPAEPGSSPLSEEGRHATAALAEAFRKTMLAKFRESRAQRQVHEKRMEQVLASLRKAPPEGFGHALSAAPGFYVIDRQGRQVAGAAQAEAGGLARANAMGADHSYREYYYLAAEAGSGFLASQPYVSPATGRPCITLTQWFQDKSGLEHLLCLDVEPQAEI
jgi:EAL domain-containing protein (putative c-di-GMP-specific phosphodiesterase class I)